jgi:hypothetical protein
MRLVLHKSSDFIELVFYSNRILSNLLRETLCTVGFSHEKCSPTDRSKFHTAMSAEYKSNKSSTLLNGRDHANVNSEAMP